MPYSDETKRKEYNSRWNKNYYALHRHEEIERVHKRRDQLVAWFRDYKDTLECCKCGENEPACLDFHHKSPDMKDISIAQACFSGWGKKRILAEVKKCMVLCSNCHRKLHSGRLL